MGKDIARLGSEKVNQTDVKIVARLQQEFASELAAITDRTTSLEKRYTVAIAKNNVQDERLSFLEKTQIHGDMSFGVLQDIGSNGIGGSNDGMQDGLGAIGRLRLTIDIPVVEDKEDSKLGAGILHTRPIGAFGKMAPVGAQGGNPGMVHYPFNGFSRISTDSGNFPEGFQTGSVGTMRGLSGGVNLRPNLYIESMMYKQHLKSGIPLLTNYIPGDWDNKENHQTTADAALGVVRWWDYFDISPYRGNEQTQFQNNAFANIPGIAVNYPQPMAVYQLHQGLGKYATADITTGVGSIQIADLMSGLNVTYEGRLNYTTGFLGEKFDKPGSVYAGGYHIFPSGSQFINNTISTLTNRSGGVYDDLLHKSAASGFYAGWNQEWYKGIGTSVGYLINDNSSSITAYTTLQPGPALVAAGARQSLNAVLNVPIRALFPKWKYDDVLGLGYAVVDIHEGGVTGSEFSDAYEHVFEAYYKWQLSNNMAVVPSFQLMTNQLGMRANGVITMFGVRMSYTF